MEEFNNVEKQSENQANQSSHVEMENVKKMLMQNRIKKMSTKKKLVTILVILLLSITGGYYLYHYQGSKDNDSYLAVTVGQSTVTDSIEATGTLSSVKESAMGFKKDETITSLNVQPGDHVKKGQIMATQDASTLNSTLQQAIRTIEQDQISIKTAELNLTNNIKTLEQQQRLFDAGVISESELDAAKDNVSKSEWEVANAQSKLLNDQAKVEQAQSDLDGATLAAPFDGIIGAVNGQVGQINGINSNSSTLLTVMSEDLQLSALVNEADIGKIKIGQEVEFTSSSYSDLIFKGEVLRITPQAQTVSNVQYYPVLISCEDPEHKLFSGMSVSANIIIARKTDVLTVPMMAVSYAQSYIKNMMVNNEQNALPESGPGIPPSNSKAFSDQTSAANNEIEGKRGRVLILENNKAVVRAVVLGLSDGSNYEVIEGLNPGEQVIVGSTKADANSVSSDDNSGNTRTNNNRNQGGRSGGMGGPPPGF